MNIEKQALIMILLITSILSAGCGKNSSQNDKSINSKGSSGVGKINEKTYKVTFIEFGSVKCIPCQQMQPVMKSIEKKYGKVVKVEFHDVWTEAGKQIGIKYAIEAIPTQVFLDETGKEYYRHVGFFPEEELVKILQMKGVK